MGKVIALHPQIESNAGPSPLPDSALAVNLTVGQLRDLVRQEVQTAMGQNGQEDRLLTAEEACSLLSVSTDWLYRHAKKLPFTCKLAPRMLRFSQRGILKWLATRKTSYPS